MRKDYYRNLWTYVAPGRDRRTIETRVPAARADTDDSCDFCPGNESRTPPETATYAKNFQWQVRVFRNKFPIVAGEDEKTDVVSATWPGATESSYGVQEVIVDTPRHDCDVPDLATPDLVALLEIYRDRIASAERDSRISWVQVFKNYGFSGGASLRHPHSQLIATAHLPAAIEEKAQHSRAGSCEYCRVYELERDGPRFIHENESFAALVPFAPRQEYEVWILSRSHLPALSSLTPAALTDLAEILRLVVGRAKEISGNYNYMLFYGPQERDFHLHIEVVPRLQHRAKAGFELATGFAVMTRTPEAMAAFYREAVNGRPLLSERPDNM